MSDIKNEFELAFEEHIGLQFGYDKTPASKAFSVGALWAALWMADYILDNTDAGVDTNYCCERLNDGMHLPGCPGILTEQIRQMKTELGG